MPGCVQRRRRPLVVECLYVQVTCELLRGGDSFALEQLGEDSGIRQSNIEYKLVTVRALDREQRDEYRLTVVCRDAGEPALSRSRDISVHVTDVNDHAPTFQRRSVTSWVRGKSREGRMRQCQP